MAREQAGFYTLCLLVLLTATLANYIAHSAQGGASRTDLGYGYFDEVYGSGYSWNMGSIVKDILSVAGANASQKFGLIQAGSQPIGNVYPQKSRRTGFSLTDGIMGLHPAKLLPSENDRTDVISMLVAGNAISAHVFTMCCDDGPKGGGKFYQGPTTKHPPSALRFPLIDGCQWYCFAKPTDGSDVEFMVGTHNIGRISGYDFQEQENIIDSGTGGLLIPDRDMYEKIMNVVASTLAADPETADILCHEVDMAEREGNCTDALAKLLREPFGITMAPDRMAKVASKVPDLWFSLGPAGKVVVSGKTFFYKLEECSDYWQVSWQHGGTKWTLGTAFFWGKTLSFDYSMLGAPALVVVGPADGCAVDYSENGKNGIPIHGANGQIFSSQAGVYTAEIAIGTPPQSFAVQLDTGSGDLLLMRSTCMMFGLESCMAYTGFCESCFREESGFILPFPSMQYTSPACKEYIAPMINDLNRTGSLVNSSAPCFISGNLSWTITNTTSVGSCATIHPEEFLKSVARTLQPFAQCAASRKECGLLKTFVDTSSSTFEPKVLATFDWKQPPPYKDPALLCDWCSESSSNGSATLAAILIPSICVPVLCICACMACYCMRSKRHRDEDESDEETQEDSD